jgi:uncharacterized protein DUF11/slime mold repeat-containing protein
MVKSAVVLLLACACSGPFASASTPHALTLADRDRAREAVERVDDRRWIGAAEMAALEVHWKISLTGDVLEGELRRIARETKPPERLLEIYAALGNDSFLVEECLARPSYVERVSRDRFAFDPVLHAGARAEAEELRRRLLSGDLSPWSDYPGRSVIMRPPRESEGAGHVSALEEERESFVVSVVLSATTRRVRVARYVVAKMTFETWWATAKLSPPGESIAAVPREPARLPLPVSAPNATSACASGQQTADLAVTSSVAPNPVAAGGIITSTIVMQNGGPDAAPDAEMLEEPPEGTTYRSITWPAADGDWICTVPAVGAHGKISCTNKCFAAGSSVTFTLESEVEPCVGSIELTGTAIASHASGEPDDRNNTAVATTTVIDPGTCDDGDVCTEDDRCGPGLGFMEDFDLVDAPLLPPGWTAGVLAGPPGAGSWTTTQLHFDTEPNSAYIPDASDVRDLVLDSPSISIQSPSAQLRFRNRYDLERNNDGGVLEIKIGDGPFEDILDAGGSFVSGGYDHVIDLTFGSPIAGRLAWTGIQSQFVATTVNLPAAAAGQAIVLRWRMATDVTLGATGQWIDSIAVTGRNRCVPGTPVSCDDGDACTTDSCERTTGCGHLPISCDDGEVCTNDACDPLVGCVHTNSTAACNDSNVCTRTDVCEAGVCVGSNLLVCHDADACTADACDRVIGCLETTANFDTTGFSAGRVDGRDLAILAASWHSCPNALRYNPAANLDREQPCIDGTDFHLFMTTFGRDCTP